MTAFSIRRARPEDQADITRLCWDYRALLIDRAAACPGVVEAAYAKDSYAALLAELPRIHARPAGDMFVAVRGGLTIGCAMYYPLGPEGVTEIKRVYLAPEARGFGAGKALMQACLDGAQADGYSRAVVDTIAPLTEAIALYRHLGFAPCAPFYDPDPAFLDILRFYDKALT